MKTIILIITCFSFLSLLSIQLPAQDQALDSGNNTHYESVPAYPETLTAGTSLARIIDGLGFRYYWVSKDLTPKDLDYHPSTEARTTLETLSHINYMLLFIENTLTGETTVFPEPALDMTYPKLRATTLKRIQSISEKLSVLDSESLSRIDIKLQAGGNDMDFPIWHILQGPIGDAYYHLGQVVSFRRTTGNPIDPTVQPFMGKRMNP